MGLSPPTLFDKIINVDLYAKGASSPTVSIKCPEYTPGKSTAVSYRKPDISLTGSLVADVACPGMQLRITNYGSREPLDIYSDGGRFVVSLGYRGFALNTIQGEIATAYEEKPGPDAITTFQLLIGNWTSWVSSFIDVQAPSGATISSVVDTMASQLSFAVGRNISISSKSISLKVTSAPINFHGMFKDLAYTLKKSYNILVQPNGDALSVCDMSKGSSNVTTINYITSVKRDAANYTIKAPFDPNIRPMDTIVFNTKYAQQTYGGALVPPTSNLVVLTEQFEFETVRHINNMTIWAIDTSSTGGIIQTP